MPMPRQRPREAASPMSAVTDARTILVLPLQVRGQTEGADYVGRSFAEALADESSRRHTAMKSGMPKDTLDSYFHQGDYAKGLRRWFAHVDQDQIMIIQSERFFTDPARSYSEVLEFLDLAPHDLGRYNVHNAAPHAAVDDDVRDALAIRYRESNAHLYEMVGQDFGWT